jgi:hypothetical protein
MRQALLSASVTFAATLIAFGASAASNDNTMTSSRHHVRPAVHAPLAQRPQEFRASNGADMPASRLNDGLYHDPRFSIQQDEIYEGRF